MTAHRRRRHAYRRALGRRQPGRRAADARSFQDANADIHLRVAADGVEAMAF